MPPLRRWLHAQSLSRRDLHQTALEVAKLSFLLDRQDLRPSQITELSCVCRA